MFTYNKNKIFKFFLFGRFLLKLEVELFTWITLNRSAICMHANKLELLCLSFSFFSRVNQGGNISSQTEFKNYVKFLYMELSWKTSNFHCFCRPVPTQWLDISKSFHVIFSLHWMSLSCKLLRLHIPEDSRMPLFYHLQSVGNYFPKCLGHKCKACLDFLQCFCLISNNYFGGVYFYLQKIHLFNTRYPTLYIDSFIIHSIFHI